jgi:hypothetical protein
MKLPLYLAALVPVLTLPLVTLSNKPKELYSTQIEVLIPIPEPELAQTTNIPAVCTRNGTIQALPVVDIVDTPIPQHCVEPNCGLGVYTEHVNEVGQRCSFCGAARPVSL